MTYHLAIDIGASSGRHMIGYVENDQLKVQEIYRFKNQLVEKDGHICWDIDRLFDEILNGMKRCKQLDMIPQTMGIDTWGCDYVLLDPQGNRISHAIAYRDEIHEQYAGQYLKNNSKYELYARNGLQYQPFNTLFQLYGDQRKSEAETFLMIPDYLAYRLTGTKVNEFSNLSTTGLLNVHEKTLDRSLLKQAGICFSLFPPMVEAGTTICNLSETIREQIGFDTQVIAIPSHDTASAYLASPHKEEIILSSGTWSLIGCILDEPIIASKACDHNFTNEGCANRQIRFLQNIMGLWIIQEVSRNLNGKYSFSELVELAKADPYPYTFDVNKAKFLHPENMIETIQEELMNQGIEPPRQVGQIADCVYRSLAEAVKTAVNQLEQLTEKQFETINIIGEDVKTNT